ncbi:MAG: DNA-binding protein [Erysipelotrichia bacterium]|nr:DNA-binding protein [Erysipelotrichia bacterium]
MGELNKLLNLKEVSQILNINTEVLRRWLRTGKLSGVKVGSDWRVNPDALQPFLNPDGKASAPTKPSDNPQKMCFRFPKWLEFSGLPAFFNQKYGPEAWPVFKKLIELDFELGKPTDRMIRFTYEELSERVGYKEDKIRAIVATLDKVGYIELHQKNSTCCFMIVTPIKTPKLILDIPYEKGGVRGAPGDALKNSCLRRFLESDVSE